MKQKFWLLMVACASLSGCGVEWFPGVTNTSNSNTDNSNLTAPTLRAALSPTTIASGGTSTLTLTILNKSGNPAQTNLGFSETLPTGVTATVANSSQCGGQLDVIGSKLVFIQGALASGTASCNLTATLTATATGSTPQTFVIQASDFDSTQFQGTPDKLVNGVTNQTLTVTPAAVTTPTLTAALSPAALVDGNNAVLNFTITNAASTPAQTGIGFVETLPAGLTANITSASQCGGTVSVNSAASPATITFTGGQLASGAANCTVSANIGLGSSLLNTITTDQTFTLKGTDVGSLQGGLINGVTDQTLKVFPTAVTSATGGVTISNLTPVGTADATQVNFTFDADTANTNASAVTATVELAAVDSTGTTIATTDKFISFSVPAGLLTRGVTISATPVPVTNADFARIAFWRLLGVTVP